MGRHQFETCAALGLLIKKIEMIGSIPGPELNGYEDPLGGF
jgi:hypothetical protein